MEKKDIYDDAQQRLGRCKKVLTDPSLVAQVVMEKNEAGRGYCINISSGDKIGFLDVVDAIDELLCGVMDTQGVPIEEQPAVVLNTFIKRVLERNKSELTVSMNGDEEKNGFPDDFRNKFR